MILTSVLVGVFLLLSAFFSGMEMAFVSASKLKIELSKTQGQTSGRLLSYFVKNPSRFIGTYLVGNNVALVVYGILLGQLLKPVLSRFLPDIEILALLVETIIGTLIVLVFGEFLPKLMFRLNADKFLHRFSVPFYIAHILLFLPVVFINWLTKVFMQVFFKIKLNETNPVFNEIDLEHYVKETLQQQNDDDDIDAELLGNALELKEVRVRECLIPRPEIVAIELTNTIDELRQIIIESGYSKILVYKETIDNVLGYVHHFDLHKKPKNIKQILKQMPVVPETMYAQKLLMEFKNNGRTIALVVDEYGGTAGIITFEDILEEIFGEIKDEHDDVDFIEEQIALNEFLFSGRLEIDYINENYDLNIPEGDYETLSGYIISITEHIPEMSSVVNSEFYRFKILNVSNTKIETIKVIQNL